MEEALEVERRYDQHGDPGFQSLFSWKRHWKLSTLDGGLTEAKCFNPCFHGRGTGSLTCLVLFHALICFNPCFHGRGTGSNRMERNPGSRSAVSILVFMEEALEEPMAAVCTSRFLFQSLFSWKRHWKSGWGTTFQCAGKFQSLFSWKRHWKVLPIFFYNIVVFVSILVFMEEALEVNA